MANKRDEAQPAGVRSAPTPPEPAVSLDPGDELVRITVAAGQAVRCAVSRKLVPAGGMAQVPRRQLVPSMGREEGKPIEGFVARPLSESGREA